MKEVTVNNYTVRDVRPSDQKTLCDIANHYIENSYASFHPVPADKKYFEGLVKMTKNHAFLALEHEGRLIGYGFFVCPKTQQPFRKSREGWHFHAP